MKTFERECVVKCDIKKVWNFFMDPRHIERISPTEFNEILLKCSTPQLSLNTDLWVSTGLFVKKRWHSRITRFDEFYEFMDEVQQSKLLKWAHLHRFIPVGDQGTQVIDEVKFEFAFGLLGRAIEGIVFPKLEQVFSFREQKIKEILED